jgi:hypothetical protein
MDWWVWVLLLVVLVAIGWGVRRSRQGKAVHPDQAAINGTEGVSEGVVSVSAAAAATPRTS